MSSGYVEVGSGRDMLGRPWKVGVCEGDLAVISGDGSFFVEGAELDRFAEAVARAVTPGQVGG